MCSNDILYLYEPKTIPLNSKIKWLQIYRRTGIPAWNMLQYKDHSRILIWSSVPFNSCFLLQCKGMPCRTHSKKSEQEVFTGMLLHIVQHIQYVQRWCHWYVGSFLAVTGEVCSKETSKHRIVLPSCSALHTLVPIDMDCIVPWPLCIFSVYCLYIKFPAYFCILDICQMSCIGRHLKELGFSWSSKSVQFWSQLL